MTLARKVPVTGAQPHCHDIRASASIYNDLRASGGKYAGGVGAPDGAPNVDFAKNRTPTDPDLAALIAAWPNLPSAVKAGIVAMVKATG